MTPRLVVPPFIPGLKGSFPTKRAAKTCGTGGGGSGRAQGRTNSTTQEASVPVVLLQARCAHGRCSPQDQLEAGWL